MNSSGECLVFIAAVKTITYLMALETLLPFKDDIKRKEMLWANKRIEAVLGKHMKVLRCTMLLTICSNRFLILAWAVRQACNSAEYRTQETHCLLEFISVNTSTFSQNYFIFRPFSVSLYFFRYFHYISTCLLSPFLYWICDKRPTCTYARTTL
jgi:hypothetical protein